MRETIDNDHKNLLTKIRSKEYHQMGIIKESITTQFKRYSYSIHGHKSANRLVV